MSQTDSTPPALSPVAQTDLPTAAVSEGTRRPRTWSAILALYLLSPIVAELLTGSTPPLKWLNPIGVLLLTGLYGSGAILARELVRRQGLGWDNLLLLGVAYGALEEGVVVQSWFIPGWSGQPDAARFLEINWTLVVIFTTIHMALSIGSAVVLAEALLPRVAARPWLGRRGVVAFAVWLGLVVVFGFVGSGFLQYRAQGYAHPPLTYVIAPALFVFFLGLGVSLRLPKITPRADGRLAPRLWTVRLAAFFAAFVVLAILFVLRTVIRPAFVSLTIVLAIDTLSLLVVRRWAKRRGWSARHRLALASGVIGCFIVLSPVLEFVLPKGPEDNLTGLTLVNAVALIGLIALAWRARQVARQGVVRAA